MRPDLRQQLEINRIDSLGILSEQMVNRRAIGGGVGGCLFRESSGEWLEGRALAGMLAVLEPDPTLLSPRAICRLMQ
jgi:hypothetical protein